MMIEKPLSPVEQSRLGELEAIIRENLKAWYAVGMAMIEIREAPLSQRRQENLGRILPGDLRHVASTC